MDHHILWNTLADSFAIRQYRFFELPKSQDFRPLAAFDASRNSWDSIMLSPVARVRGFLSDPKTITDAGNGAANDLEVLGFELLADQFPEALNTNFMILWIMRFIGKTRANGDYLVPPGNRMGMRRFSEQMHYGAR